MPYGLYPKTVIEVLDDTMVFPAAVLEAMRQFRHSRPWTGSVRQRIRKFRKANRLLAKACGLTPPDLVIGHLDGSSSASSYYLPALHCLVLTGRLSVVTLLHEFAHAQGMGEREACRWSINLFRRIFPKPYSRLVHRAHTLVRTEDL